MKKGKSKRSIESVRFPVDWSSKFPFRHLGIPWFSITVSTVSPYYGFLSTLCPNLINEKERWAFTKESSTVERKPNRISFLFIESEINHIHIERRGHFFVHESSVPVTKDTNLFSPILIHPHHYWPKIEVEGVIDGYSEALLPSLLSLLGT